MINDFIIFLSGILLYFLLDLMKALYKKKIEQNVVKENTPVITRLSEKVKQEFRTEFAEINSKLNHLTNQSTLVDEKSIQALNNFFERTLEIKDVHSQNFGDFLGKDFTQELIDYQKLVDRIHRKLYSDYHNLALFHIKNEEIINHANDIVVASDSIKKTFKEHFGKIKVSIMSEKGMFGDIPFAQALSATDKLMADYLKVQKPNFDKFNSAFNELMKSLNKYYSGYGLNFLHKELTE